MQRNHNINHPRLPTLYDIRVFCISTGEYSQQHKISRCISKCSIHVANLRDSREDSTMSVVVHFSAALLEEVAFGLEIGINSGGLSLKSAMEFYCFLGQKGKSREF